MIATVNRKGLVTNPESLRDRYGFPPGTKVVWLERDADVISKPLLSVERLRGRVTGAERTAMLLEEPDRGPHPRGRLIAAGSRPGLTGDVPEAGAAEVLQGSYTIWYDSSGWCERAGRDPQRPA